MYVYGPGEWDEPEIEVGGSNVEEPSDQGEAMKKKTVTMEEQGNQPNQTRQRRSMRCLPLCHDAPW